MAQSVSSPIPPVSNTAERALGAPELIDRLAEELRASSDMDLPHSYFVEQVRLGLAGSANPDRMAANAVEGSARNTRRTANAAVFRAWAMPD